ncbi:hypothetical protein K491DRAFT_773176 [Lophiostoma macrostomum CBS 122681]|uniref:Uncharacterized protein n=1 Tax=Lophiostoma macrostomum CBS 122681 TaxID=1314788 RepID=A0A6A6TS70_9PLEO|nr:hypothetical protein K491DRAFT_773176 [Lophiostoma macrostomum CBS 122681]
MRFLTRILNSIPTAVSKRTYAKVHDVQIVLQRPGNSNQGKGTMERNVFQKPLQLHSTRPLTGFTRTGYCEAPKSDFGNHSVAAVVSDEFLDFSASRGNDLRQVGLTGGCKWCLCVNRWKEAFDARKGDDDKLVPKIYLQKTNERALEGVKIEQLEKFALDKEGN